MIINLSSFGGGGGGYTLPVASQSTLGGVKIGSGLDIDSGGTLSVSGGTGGGIPVYDYYVLNDDSTARTELIDIVSGGTQAAAISKDGTLYYYKGYDDDYGRYAFINPKATHFNEGGGGGVNFMFYSAVLLNSDDAMTEDYGTHCNLQEYCYTTSEYAKHDIQKNGMLYSKANIYDILAGSTPVIGETYNAIYFTVPGMLWWDNSMSVTVPGVNEGQPFGISWWSGEAWNVDGVIYDNQTTTVSGLTVDFSHVIDGDIGYISVSCPLGMTVTDIPNGGEGGGTSISSPVKASANLEIYRSGEWNSISPLPNLIYSGVSDGELASILTKVRTNLYNGAYAGTERFFLLYNGLSQTVLSFGYSAVSGVSETLILKAIDYTAVIVRDIPNGTYSLSIVSNANIWIGTQQEYDLLPSYDNNTLYVIR